MASQKKPLVALILSLVLPGLGQAYNREVVKGIIIAGACLALAAGSLWLSGIWQLSAALAFLVLWVSAILDGYKTAKLLGQPLDWYYRVSYVVTMLLLVGPLALPLLWRSPYFSRRARWIWAVVVILNLLLLLPMAYLLRWLRQKISGAI
jgi:TM2 domain-containing membrane protein YozV